MTTAQTLEVPGYQVMQFLGSGARSTIWQIRDRRTDQLHALKRVVKRSSADERFLEQAINEYRVATQMNHPVVRRIIRMRRAKRWLSVREIHLIMEFCEGRSIQECRPRNIALAVAVFEEVAKGLAAMNAAGFVHADIKPNNIIVAPDGTVKIIDLGQSCPIGTVKERIQGTPDFIAPEQVHRQPLDGRTDVFNFGAALYWTLTARAIPTLMPKQNSTTLVTDLVVTPPEQINRSVPGPLSKIVKDCIEASPSGRPASMKIVASRLGLIAHTLRRNSANSQ